MNIFNTIVYIFHFLNNINKHDIINCTDLIEKGLYFSDIVYNENITHLNSIIIKM